MSRDPAILVEFIVVAALECLVAEEVDGSILNTAWKILLVLNVLQTVCLVPACWKDIERYLTSDRVAANLLARILICL